MRLEGAFFNPEYVRTGFTYFFSRNLHVFMKRNYFLRNSIHSLSNPKKLNLKAATVMFCKNSCPK